MNSDIFAAIVAKSFIIIVFLMGMTALVSEIINGTLPL